MAGERIWHSDIGKLTRECVALVLRDAEAADGPVYDRIETVFAAKLVALTEDLRREIDRQERRANYERDRRIAASRERVPRPH